MTFEWINESNALIAAQYLLDLDASCIKSVYQEDVSDWVISLKQAQEQYLNHRFNMRDKPDPVSQFDLEKYSLNVLLLRIRAFLPLLTSYGAECLHIYLTNMTERKHNPT